MPLGPGVRLGSYEIAGPLGAGGMGEVYRALDTTLGREVAIKILPDTFAADPGRLARLEREARTLASLNHPHIAAIYGFERAGGVHALVMELVEGDDLSARLVRGPLPVEDALAFGRQIAEALEAAHDQGIVHRDLKPANIKVREDGTVKVLDFGLAKSVEKGDESGRSLEGLSQSPTVLSPAMTQMGLILGTAAYMSPEQAKGRPADRRSDIWAFGCVLFEMLSGRRAFEGEDVSETLASLLKQDVDWSALPDSTPLAIRTLLRRCLQKNPKHRWQSAADVRIEIEEAISAPAATEAPASAAGRVGWRWMAMAAAAVLVAGALGAIAGWSLTRSTEPKRVARVVVGVAPAAQVATPGGPNPLPHRTAFALSPDGSTVVFVGELDGRRRLYLRRLDSLDAVAIAGTDDGDSPFFSPDGRWIGFWQGVYSFGASGALKKVSVAGGPALTLCDTGRPTGVSWGTDGRIVFAQGSLGGLWHIADGGGVPEPLTTVDPGSEISHRLPHVLPAGKGVLFTIVRSVRRLHDAQTVVQTPGGGERKVLIEGGVDARYVPTGHLVYARGGALMAVPFDLDRLQVTGDPTALLEGLMQDVNSYSASGRSGAAQFAVSLDGTLAYVPGPTASGAPGTPAWIDRRGTVERLAVKPEASLVRISPDGQQVLFEGQNLSSYDVDRGILSRLPFEGGAAIWHPDGRRLTYSSRTTGPANVFSIPIDGSGPAERLTTSDKNQAPSSWTPDGKTLAFSHFEGATNRDIWILSLETGAPVARPLLTSPSEELWPDFSPDGRFLAYVTRGTGRDEVFVRPYPGPGPSVQVSNNGGMQPAWASNGRELFYTEAGNGGIERMMAVDVTIGGTFRAGRPRQLFEADFGVTIPNRSYDVTRDATRFIVILRDDAKPAAPITGIVLVQNWFEELRRLAPAR